MTEQMLNQTKEVKRYNKITANTGKRKSRKLKDNPSEYKLIKMANSTFLFCIIFEVVGIMTIMFFGTVGAQMSIYFMTFLFSLFLYLKHKDDFRITVSLKKMSSKKMVYFTALTICGIPVAMVLNALADFLAGTGIESTNEVTAFPVIPALIIYALIPAIVEEFVFRGIILGIYEKVDVRAGILISSLFFALLHFSPGSVLYGFLFGVIFALVRVRTGNLLYTICMHCAFNGVNVLMSYVDMVSVPKAVMMAASVIMIVVFIISQIIMLRGILQDGVNLPSMTNKSKYVVYRLITKEGYVTMMVCVTITGLLCL